MSLDEQFDIFWDCFPNKKGKKVAFSAFKKAIRETTLKTMLDAIDAYKMHKPKWQDYCHPATWLNQGRWDDVWEPQEPEPDKTPPALAAFRKTIEELDRMNGYGQPQTH